MTATQVRLPPMMTVAEFIEWPGDGTPTRYELVDGVLREKEFGTATHGVILATVAALICNHARALKPSIHGALMPNIQPRVRGEWNCRIADFCTTELIAQPGWIITPEPILVGEVLAPGTAQNVWDNVWAYTTIPSAREIMVVHSARMMVEMIYREAGAWPENPTVTEAGGIVRVNSIGASIPIEEIYVGTHIAQGCT